MYTLRLQGIYNYTPKYTQKPFKVLNSPLGKWVKNDNISQYQDVLQWKYVGPGGMITLIQLIK